MTRQEWRDIDEFPGWAISDEGLVINDRTKHILRIGINKQGIVNVLLVRDRKQYCRSVAVLVAKAFVDVPTQSRPTQWGLYNSVIHLNGDRQDCRAMNLMWRPRWYAIKYNKMFNDQPYRLGVYVPALNQKFSSLREFCTTYGVVEEWTYWQMFGKEPCFHYNWMIERIEE